MAVVPDSSKQHAFRAISVDVYGPPETGLSDPSPRYLIVPHVPRERALQELVVGQPVKGFEGR